MLVGSKEFIEQTILEARIEKAKVSQVFLVGGTTMISFFRLSVHELLPNAFIHYDDKRADKCVAYGAACRLVLNKKDCLPIGSAWPNK